MNKKIYTYFALFLTTLFGIGLFNRTNTLFFETNFNDVANEAGVTMPSIGLTFYDENISSHEVKVYIRNGAAWGDIDQDGCVDLYVANPAGANLLYKNNCDGTFTDIASMAGVAYEGKSSGVAFGDIDNDYCLDLFVANHEEQNLLYKNNCDGTFTDISKNAGIQKLPLSSTGASWADYNNDGYLDIFVTNISKDPIQFGLTEMTVVTVADNLFKNNGDGTFTDVAREAGVSGPSRFVSYQDSLLARSTDITGISYASAWFDYNNDTCIDLMVASDTGSSPLYKNNCDGTFTDVTEETGLAAHLYGMGIAAADINRDSFLDVYISNGETSMLFINTNGVGFNNEAIPLGIKQKQNVSDSIKTDLINEIEWGTAFFDMDNDGDQDLYAVAGGFSVDEGIGSNDILYRFDQTGAPGTLGVFKDITQQSGVNNRLRSYGLAIADYDNDGDIDMYVVNTNGDNNLYVNTTKKDYHWLNLKLHGIKSNSLGIGAKIKVTTEDAILYEQIKGGTSYGSQHEYFAHFGLKESDHIHEILIEWPSGIKQKLIHPMIDQTITITEEL